MQETFEELVGRFPPEVGSIAWRARELALELVPGAVESCEGGDYGVGTTAGYKGLVFVVTPGRDNVRLGLPNGARLPDPHGLLEGSGKVHRFVRLTSADQLERPALIELLRAQASPS